MSQQGHDLIRILHRNGYRLTPQRQVILDAFRETNGHVSTDEIVSIVKSKSSAIDRATVYRTLSLFKELRIVNSTSNNAGRLEYEIAGAVTHHHIVCRSCGSDLEIMGEDLACVEKLLHERYGFEVDLNHITLRGHCINCRVNS